MVFRAAGEFTLLSGRGVRMFSFAFSRKVQVVLNESSMNQMRRWTERSRLAAGEFTLLSGEGFWLQALGDSRFIVVKASWFIIEGVGFRVLGRVEG